MVLYVLPVPVQLWHNVTRFPVSNKSVERYLTSTRRVMRALFSERSDGMGKYIFSNFGITMVLVSLYFFKDWFIRFASDTR